MAQIPRYERGDRPHLPPKKYDWQKVAKTWRDVAKDRLKRLERAEETLTKIKAVYDDGKPHRSARVAGILKAYEEERDV